MSTIKPYQQPPANLPAVVVVDPEVVRDLTVADQAVTALGDITTEAQCSVGRDVLLAVNTLAKQVETQRAAAKKPYLEAGKQIDAAAKTVLDPLNKLVAVVKGKLADYAMACERARQEALAEQRRREQEAEAAAQETGRTAELVTDVEVPAAAGIATRQTPEVEILDRRLIPLDYMIVDVAALKRDLLDGKEVPGARLVTKLTVVAR